MEHPDLTVSTFMGNSIDHKGVEQDRTLHLARDNKLLKCLLEFVEINTFFMLQYENDIQISIYCSFHRHSTV